MNQKRTEYFTTTLPLVAIPTILVTKWQTIIMSRKPSNITKRPGGWRVTTRKTERAVRKAIPKTSMKPKKL